MSENESKHVKSVSEDTVELDYDEIIAMRDELNEILGEDEKDSDFPLEPITMDDETLTAILGSQEAQVGMEIASMYAGMFVTLYNVGVPISDCVEIIQNEQNARNNLEIQRINLEIAKLKSIQAEKSEL